MHVAARPAIASGPVNNHTEVNMAVNIEPNLGQYPEAPRYIDATPALVEGWCGPVRSQMLNGPEAWDRLYTRHPVTEDDVDGVVLDPMRPEVRDHLIRRLSLPAWLRDGAGLEPWQSAGLIACAAAGVTAKWMFEAWRPFPADGVCDGWDRWSAKPKHVYTVYARCYGDDSARWGTWGVHLGPGRDQNFGGGVGGSTGEAGKLAADAAALAHGCALMQDADTMLLPWPGGPRVWRRA